VGPRAGLKILRRVKDFPPLGFEHQIVELLAQHYSDYAVLTYNFLSTL